MMPSSGSISRATSNRKSTSSPRSLATRSIVLTWETLLTRLGHAASAATASGRGRQFHGSNSASRCAGWPAMRESTSASHEVAPDFRTTGLVGGSLLRKALNGAEHDEGETED